MENINILNTIKELVNSEETEFIPIEQFNMIYIDYGRTKEYIQDVAETSKAVATLFDATVIAHYNNIDLVIEAETDLDKVYNQRLMEIHNRNQYIVHEHVNEIIKNINKTNIEQKLKQLYPIIIDLQTRKYTSLAQREFISKTMVNIYKSSLPDSYLDEKVKTLQKQIKRG